MQNEILSGYAMFKTVRAAFALKISLNNFQKNRLTSEMERGIILLNKDKHAVFIKFISD